MAVVNSLEEGATFVAGLRRACRGNGFFTLPNDMTVVLKEGGKQFPIAAGTKVLIDWVEEDSNRESGFSHALLDLGDGRFALSVLADFSYIKPDEEDARADSPEATDPPDAAVSTVHSTDGEDHS